MRRRGGFILVYPRRDFSSFTDTKLISVKNWNRESAIRQLKVKKGG
jgi:hypothetical protein